MKVYIPNTSSQSLGGGWTFLRNFRKGAGDKLTFVNNWREADIILIVGATMTDRTEMEYAKKVGKKIFFRIDNIPRDSRNRGTAFSRMKDFAKLSDKIIYQSRWARSYVGEWLELSGINTSYQIVYNGVDNEFFFCNDKPADRDEVYLYVQYNRDENKRFPEVAYSFHNIYKNYLKHKEIDSTAKKPRLVLVGQFSPELVQYNFDFFAGENVSYWNVIDNPNDMGNVMRKCKYLMFPAFMDAAPNTVLEAIACGLEIKLVNDIGGTIEMVNLGSVPTIQDMANNYIKIFNEL